MTTAEAPPTADLLLAGARTNGAPLAALTLLRDSGLLARADVRGLWGTYPGRPGAAYLKADVAVLARDLPLSTGEHRLLTIALSLHGAVAIYLESALAGLDRVNQALVVQAIANAVQR